jgi:hypothetical protein
MASKVAQPVARAMAKPFNNFNNRRTRFWQDTGKVVAIGRNYAYPSPPLPLCRSGALTFSDHIAELGNQRPSKPFFFLKPSSSIVAPVSYNKESDKVDTGILPMLIPAGVNVHYEVELAVIMAHPWGAPRPQNPNIKANGEGEEPWEDAIQGYAIGMFYPTLSCCGAR